MPPKKKISAPPGRVYKSSIPLKQTTFLEPRKRVTSYGKPTMKRVPKPDNTLTQMDYVRFDRSALGEEGEGEDEEGLEEEGDLEGGDLYEVGSVPQLKKSRGRGKAKAVQNEEEDMEEEEHEQDDYGNAASKKRRSKRRKTTGDELNETKTKPKKDNKKRRRTIGNAPTPSSKFHTQTLTQLESWSSFSKSPSPPREEGNSIFSGPTSSRTILPRRRTALKPSSPQPEVQHPPNQTNTMPPPQTPRRRLNPNLEIPSSQSPATPFSLPRSSPRWASGREPLGDVQINTPIPFVKPSPKKISRLVVRDTFSSDGQSQVVKDLGGEVGKSSPFKSVRFLELDEDEDEEEGGMGELDVDDLEKPFDDHVEHDETLADENMTEEDQITELSVPTEEIQDHENLDEENQAEEDVFEEQNELDEQDIEDSLVVKIEPAPTQVGFQHSTGQRTRRDEILDSEAETNTDDEDFNAESEQEEDELLSEEDPDKEVQEPETYYGDIGFETQREVEQLISSQEMSDEEGGSQILGDSKWRRKQMESQRLSFTQADLMAPRTNDSDIYISIHPPHVRNIRKRNKDHEFRAWAFPPSVGRIWIYETAPTSTVKYMAAIGPAKRPGEIIDEKGEGNAEFNANTGTSQYAYEILSLYELANPLSMADLRAKEWLKGPPQKMVWVKPAVLDEMMGNLKPVLFTKSPQELPESSSTDTQEAEAQLMSTIQQFTQAPDSEHINSTPIPTNNIISPDVPAPTQHSTPHHIPPSQAETVDLSQAGTPHRAHHHPEIIMESPTRPVHSTPQLPTPAARSSREDSVVPYSLASSQLLSKSQMLPDSLLNESVPRPPPFVMDSDDDSE